MRTDEELLQAVARQRDPAALSDLVTRHQRAAFGLACYITGGQDHAEDAVQGGWLRVWQSAASYRAEGPARAWILRVMARESIRVRNAARRKGEKMNYVEDPEALLSPAAAAHDSIERQELLGALRGFLGELAEEQRVILALYYGSQLSQDEIADALSMPQTAVSRKISLTLEKLRGRITAAGFAAAAPLLTDPNLQEAILTPEVPPGLNELITARIFKPDGSVATAAPSTPAASHTKTAIVTCAVAVLIGAALWAMRSPAPAPPAPMPAVVSARTPFFREWNFNTASQAGDFTVTQGKWTHVPDGGPDGSGVMETDGGVVFVELKISMEDIPLRITMQSRPMRPEPRLGFLCSVGWSDYEWIAGFRNIGKPLAIVDGQWIKAETYLTGRSMDDWVGGARTSLNVFQRKSGSRLTLLIRGVHRIDNLEIEEIAPGEVPDIREYLNALNRIEPSRRKGTVIVSELPSPRPNQQVKIVFSDEE
ncbi:MAG TPA: sigma-70 family RNA polymerase sigma factor [Planctomycetota bacterium]|nr:sigma-70 family RNA polymerase sigma factor [Planctomycetota bacterium]